ncbi:MAG: four helix bundle protein [Candidatus Nealsonbacteria bacterium]|nr:four helix bundle protein [Candidatus Nealsonbacteria bacterium]
MNERIRSYRDLSVWQLGMELAEAACRLTDDFPPQQRYGLGSQLQRSAISVPANVAEGHGRDSTKQFLYDVSVAMGSLCETETHLILTERLGHANRQTTHELLGKCDRLGRMLRNLQKSLKAKLTAPPIEP